MNGRGATVSSTVAQRPRIAVIGGGANCEHDVSLSSAAAAAEALDPAVIAVRITQERDGGWVVDGVHRSFADVVTQLAVCDAVIPMVHGPGGEDGTLAALCDLVGVPHTGSPVRAGAIAMDKAATKAVATSLGIATARGAVLHRGATQLPAWSGPVVVKPVAAGSSFGVSLVAREEALHAALEAAWAIDDAALVEECMSGREIGITVCAYGEDEPETTPMLEVIGDGLFDSGRKYDGTARFAVVDDVSEGDQAQARRDAIALYRALGCAGPVRVDFFLTAGGWVLNEVNTTPGMTPQSQVPRMYAAAGISYRELIARMLAGVLPATRVRARAS